MASPPSSPPHPPSPTATGVDLSISSLPSDILKTHILTRLDGPTLASTSSTSTELNVLSNDKHLWQKISTSTWPSTSNPHVENVISTFNSGPLSFFSDAYPLVHNYHDAVSSTTTTRLISAVDIYFKDFPILSKVVENETVTGWFLCSPFRIDLLEKKEHVPTRIQHDTQRDVFLKDLENHVTLSWILINPETKRAMNVSSQRPVSVKRHWLTGDIELKFVNVLVAKGTTKRASERECVKCEVNVKCGGKEKGEVHVREVRLGIEDMEGKSLNGRDSLVILKGAMECGRRKRVRRVEEGKERYEEFLERKRIWKVKKERKEKVLDLVCFVVGVSIFVGFWSFILFR